MTVRVATANTDFVRRGDARYLAWLCDQSDVICAQEAKDTVLRKALPKGWTSLQDTTSLDRRGAAIAVRDSAIEVRWGHVKLGVLPFIQGRKIGMLARHIAVAGLTERATGRPFTPISAHLPPFRFRILQPLYIRRLRRVANRHSNVVVGTDANMALSRLGDALDLEHYGVGIVGILTSLHVTKWDVRTWGVKEHLTDHPAVIAAVALSTHKES